MFTDYFLVVMYHLIVSCRPVFETAPVVGETLTLKLSFIVLPQFTG